MGTSEWKRYLRHERPRVRILVRPECLCLLLTAVRLAKVENNSHGRAYDVEIWRILSDPRNYAQVSDIYPKFRATELIQNRALTYYNPIEVAEKYPFTLFVHSQCRSDFFGDSIDTIPDKCRVCSREFNKTATASKFCLKFVRN